MTSHPVGQEGHCFLVLESFIKKLQFSKKAYVQVYHSESAVFTVPVL